MCAQQKYVDGRKQEGEKEGKKKEERHVHFHMVREFDEGDLQHILWSNWFPPALSPRLLSKKELSLLIFPPSPISFTHLW